ncbi:MAG: S41 family peptidase [Bacteroidia bacterium]|nr:S41 family peptidase [Bacteroidia bacterium]
MKSIKKLSLILALSGAILFSAFKASEDYFEISKNLDIFSSVYKEINVSYVDEVEPGSLIKSAIDAMLKSLDPYTNFYSEAQSEDYRYQLTGEYGGVGATIKQIGEFIVVDEPYEGYPAQIADLRAGDKIIEVDGKSTKGKTSDDMTNLLKGSAGTDITLKIDRPGVGILSKSFKRAKIKVNNVPYFGMINEKTGYIKLSGFTPDAGQEVQDALKKLKSSNKSINSVILDLRGNGGGLLHEAVNVVNTFVKKGELVVKTIGRDIENNRTYSTLNQPEDLEIMLAVLIDNGSASASEIVSGSIQDLDRGILIGQKSFGKGLVQSSRILTYNTQMKLTTSKYYIPSGRCIQKLDYTHKKNGKAEAIADSLKHNYFTKNRRSVRDGEGVTPDILTDELVYSKITKSLLSKNIIFDYTNLYRNTTESVLSSKMIKFDDNDFKKFITFIEGKDYNYSTETEDALDKFKKQATKENYFNELKSEYDILQNKLKSNKNNDLSKYKNEILQILEEEIAERYYFEKGKIEASFDSDIEIKKAIEIFENPQRYTEILSGK